MRTGRPYMSIGEVLQILRTEFPDVSVSKIRFLEAEGLIGPERTASGYRKFYQRDLDRLRFILKLQRDSYLPLRVIRERLAAFESGAVTAESGATPSSAPPPVTQPQQEPRPADEEGDLASRAPAVHLTESDLAASAGLELSEVRALRDFGIVCEHQRNGGKYFDADDLHVAKIAHEFLKLGMEARHLKIFRRFAEQEAALFEQLVSPAIRTRRPEARQQAAETLNELARLGRKLRQAYLRQSLRPTLSGDR